LKKKMLERIIIKIKINSQMSNIADDILNCTIQIQKTKDSIVEIERQIENIRSTEIKTHFVNVSRATILQQKLGFQIDKTQESLRQTKIENGKAVMNGTATFVHKKQEFETALLQLEKDLAKSQVTINSYKISIDKCYERLSDLNDKKLLLEKSLASNLQELFRLESTHGASILEKKSESSSCNPTPCIIPTSNENKDGRPELWISGEYLQTFNRPLEIPTFNRLLEISSQNSCFPISKTEKH